MLKRPYLLVLGASLFFVSTWLWQSIEVSALRKEIASEKKNIVPLQGGQSSDESSQLETHLADASEVSQTAKISSRQFLELLSDKGEQGNPLLAMKSTVNLLRELRYLGEEELFSLLDDSLELLPDIEKSMEQLTTKRLKMILILAALGEHYPERILHMISNHPSPEMQEIELVPLKHLAIKDPAKAQAYLDQKTDLKATWGSDHESIMIQAWAKHDFPKALELLRKQKGNMDAIRALSVEPELIGKLKGALSNESDPRLYDSIASVLLLNSFQEEGVEGFKKLVSEIEFRDQQSRDGTLISSIMYKEVGDTEHFGKMITAVSQQISPSMIPELMNLRLSEWATFDYRAAGEWLREQSSQELRDAGAVVYAKTVSRINPATAMNWAEEISNIDSRREAQVAVFKTWYQSDPKSVEKWVSERGGSLEDWISH